MAVQPTAIRCVFFWAFFPPHTQVSKDSVRSWTWADQLHLFWQDWNFDTERHGVEAPFPEIRWRVRCRDWLAEDMMSIKACHTSANELLIFILFIVVHCYVSILHVCLSYRICNLSRSHTQVGFSMAKQVLWWESCRFTLGVLQFSLKETYPHYMCKGWLPCRGVAILGKAGIASAIRMFSVK